MESSNYIPSERKFGTAQFGEDKIDFTYRIQNIETKSPIFRTELEKWNEDSGGLIGVVFEDKKVAWSSEVPRHINLINAENNKISARFQTHLEPFSSIPVVQIDSLTLRDAEDLVSFFEHSNVRSITWVKINLTDRLDGQPTQNTNQVYFNQLGKFDHEKFRNNTYHKL